MFNLFPKKKTVDEILEENNINQKPNLAEKLVNDIYEIIALKNELQNQLDENKKLQEQNSELTKEVIGLRHLKHENADLMEILAKYRDGYQGSCYACEPVGELNQKLELQIKALHKIIDGAKETIDKLKNEIFNLKYQKHPMYPIHWGGLDSDVYEKAKNMTIEETIDDVKKEVSWEQIASDLALRVVKLENKVEELTIIKMNSDPNYQHFLKHGKWPYSAMNPDSTLKTINCNISTHSSDIKGTI
jgi:hypothetical protein